MNAVGLIAEPPTIQPHLNYGADDRESDAEKARQHTGPHLAQRAPRGLRGHFTTVGEPDERKITA